MFDNIRGVLHLRAEGEKIYSFINAIKDNHIICKRQKCVNNTFYSQIYSGDFDEVNRIAEQYNILLYIEKKRGIIYEFLKYKKRYGIFVGIVVVPALIFFISNTVVIIDINGNELNSNKQIIEALEETGIKKGAFISDIDFSYAEQCLRLSLDNVVWTAIRHTGCRIVVDIDEGEDMPEILKERIPCNIIASRDAQIVSVNVLSGHLVKIINDGVKKGDIIISGVYSDENGQVRQVHSLGDVIGIYNESVILSQNFNSYERNPTGVSVKQKFFEAFGFKIPLFIKNELPYDFEYSETLSPFMMFDNELPFSIIETEYMEYETCDVTYSEEYTEKILMDKLERYERNFMMDIEILERNIQKNIGDESMEYIVNYKLKGQIGITEEIFLSG